MALFKSVARQKTFKEKSLKTIIPLREKAEAPEEAEISDE